MLSDEPRTRTNSRHACVPIKPLPGSTASTLLLIYVAFVEVETCLLRAIRYLGSPFRFEMSTSTIWKRPRVHKFTTAGCVISQIVNSSVCVCVFFPSILDIKFVGRTSRGHTGGRSHRIFHPPSFCGECLNFSREKDSAISFPRRLCRILCTNDLIVLKPLGIFI